MHGHAWSMHGYAWDVTFYMDHAWDRIGPRYGYVEAVINKVPSLRLIVVV